MSMSNKSNDKIKEVSHNSVSQKAVSDTKVDKSKAVDNGEATAASSKNNSNAKASITSQSTTTTPTTIKSEKIADKLGKYNNLFIILLLDFSIRIRLTD
jgi:hypothetical protein